MTSALFPFFRATFYRWMQIWAAVCDDCAGSPRVLGVGDLHVENFGTWRDIEGRLIWGVNDFDEASEIPYTLDLVRLATSTHLAIAAADLRLRGNDACNAILKGYSEGLASGGRAFVLAEHHTWLRRMMTGSLRDPEQFWGKLDALPTLESRIPPGAERAMRRMLPERDLDIRLVHRTAGLGSLGHERYVAIADFRGGKVAREAKALALSACAWVGSGERAVADQRIRYEELMERSVRALDPFVRRKREWLVRRLAPDCSRVELASIPEERDESRLLHAMGFETANIHLGTRKAAKIIGGDLEKRGRTWLHRASEKMVDATTKDWESWRAATAMPLKRSAKTR